MATAAAATPAARAGESSAQATATTSVATAGPYHRVLGGSTATRATGAAIGLCCLRGGVGGGRLGLVWVSLHGERQNMALGRGVCAAPFSCCHLESTFAIDY